MKTRPANPEEIAAVLEVLKRATPQGGAFKEQIEQETGYRRDIIDSALEALEKQGAGRGRYLNEYDPEAAARADNSEGS